MDGENIQTYEKAGKSVAKVKLVLRKISEIDSDVFEVVSSRGLTNTASALEVPDYEEFLKREIKELKDYNIFGVFSNWKNKFLVIAKTQDKKYKLVKIDIFKRKIEFETELDLNFDVLEGARFGYESVVVYNRREFFIVSNNGRILEHGVIKEDDIRIEDVVYIENSGKLLLICKKELSSSDCVFGNKILIVYYYDRKTKEYIPIIDIGEICNDIFVEKAKYDALDDKLYILYRCRLYRPYKVKYKIAVFDVA